MPVAICLDQAGCQVHDRQSIEAVSGGICGDRLESEDAGLYQIWKLRLVIYSNLLLSSSL